MELDKLRDELKAVTFDSKRLDCDNHFEAVIIKDELEKLVKRLENVFGKPVWPSGKRLSFQLEEAIKSYGGIMPGQTLYFLEEEKKEVFAMLWPWQDGVHTTVKIISRV
ncbi:MAG: hypothetical protein PHO70_06650 [Candidatus Omnitrophica bacterium]|nr:hypothetical protein [Candidatus Omnitrophota bacterium]